MALVRGERGGNPSARVRKVGHGFNPMAFRQVNFVVKLQLVIQGTVISRLPLDVNTIFFCVNLKIVWYKRPAMTTTGDVVLVYFEEQPVFFARIEEIAADRRRDWCQVRLLIFQVPLSEVTWTIRKEYINGEPFTMTGKAIRLEKVEGCRRPAKEEPHSEPELKKKGMPEGDNVISMFDRKRDA